jgi:branched-chain amino acid transport system permease protein
MLRNLTWKQIAAFLGLVFIVLYPLLFGNRYIMHIFILFFIWSIVASNWNLLMGYAGIFSLGNVAFLAIGGYTSAMLAKHFGISPSICILLGGLGSMASVTLILGIPSLRLSGIYIALLSLTFNSALFTIINQARRFTGGNQGLSRIPKLYAGVERIHAYYIIFAAFLIILFAIHRIIHSKTGMAFMALRDSKELATALGVNEYKEKLKVFAISAFFTGIAGGFSAHYLGHISTNILGIGTFILTVNMMFLGGIGRFPGAVLGALIMVFGSEFLRLTGIFRLAVLGIMICAIIRFLPGGLMELLDLLDKKIAKIRHGSIT